MSNKRKYIKNPFAGKKKKLGTNQQASERGSLLNLSKVYIMIKGMDQ